MTTCTIELVCCDCRQVTYVGCEVTPDGYAKPKGKLRCKHRSCKGCMEMKIIYGGKNGDNKLA